MMQVAPRCTKVWLKYSELAWHIGITIRPVSWRVKPISSAVASAISVLPSWLRMAPLGRPVVPEVYISAHGSPGFTVTAGGAVEAAAISASYGCQPGGGAPSPKCSHSTRATGSSACTGCTRSCRSCCTMKARASLCCTM